MAGYTDIYNELNKFYKSLNIDNNLRLLSVSSDIYSNRLKYAEKVVTLLDLTTLEGNDTFEKVRSLCGRALLPVKKYNHIRCAAVCTYPKFISAVRKALKNSGVKTASVAASFPSGQVPLELKLKEVEYCVKESADEIDMVISRGEFLSGNYDFVYREISEVNNVCKNSSSTPVHLKVILETGELGTPQNIHLASAIAIDAGADFIKTSTGKINIAATLPASFVMLKVIKEHYENTGKKIGFKPAGGIRKTSDALQFMTLVKNMLGDDWLSPGLFRIGASSLLDDLAEELNAK
ncbi:MAG: deoxyribose-phosphate aldolase [Ignavibacteria bacterium]|jgi:deoxyribose-phosphate aldolase|nr:deoxyribose-phosphate aldolase [Ignavibacteria bacterium]